MKRLPLFMRCAATLLLVAGPPVIAQETVDRTTLTGKVMCGYQGWFNCEGDGLGRGWVHWARHGRRPFGPGNVTVDLWPDVSELAASERYETGFRHADGRPGEVFSSADRATVVRHFKWMHDYGIDGVFLQRFAVSTRRPDGLAHNDRVLTNVRAGANRYGRTFAMMYDLSGLRAGQVASVREDWKSLQARMKVTDDPAYLHHRGAPVVSIWGIGFNDGRDYKLSECLELVRWFKSEGCTVMLGVPSFWRDGRRDATDDPILHEAICAADIVSPWSVGRYRTPDQSAEHAEHVWTPDRRWCDSHELDFMPVAFPGFSWHNLNGGRLNEIPRLKGKFLWSQVAGARQAGCTMLYVAMFDEVDEGTAIFKCTNDPPTGDGARFSDLEGVPSDHYLKLVGQAGKVFRGEVLAKSDLPAWPNAAAATAPARSSAREGGSESAGKPATPRGAD